MAIDASIAHEAAMHAAAVARRLSPPRPLLPPSAAQQAILGGLRLPGAAGVTPIRDRPVDPEVVSPRYALDRQATRAEDADFSSAARVLARSHATFAAAPTATADAARLTDRGRALGLLLGESARVLRARGLVGEIGSPPGPAGDASGALSGNIQQPSALAPQRHSGVPAAQAPAGPPAMSAAATAAATAAAAAATAYSDPAEAAAAAAAAYARVFSESLTRSTCGAAPQAGQAVPRSLRDIVNSSIARDGANGAPHEYTAPPAGDAGGTDRDAAQLAAHAVQAPLPVTPGDGNPPSDGFLAEPAGRVVDFGPGHPADAVVGAVRQSADGRSAAAYGVPAAPGSGAGLMASLGLATTATPQLGAGATRSHSAAAAAHGTAAAVQARLGLLTTPAAVAGFTHGYTHMRDPPSDALAAAGSVYDRYMLRARQPSHGVGSYGDRVGAAHLPDHTAHLGGVYDGRGGVASAYTGYGSLGGLGGEVSSRRDSSTGPQGGSGRYGGGAFGVGGGYGGVGGATVVPDAYAYSEARSAQRQSAPGELPSGRHSGSSSVASNSDRLSTLQAILNRRDPRDGGTYHRDGAYPPTDGALGVSVGGSVYSQTSAARPSPYAVGGGSSGPFRRSSDVRRADGGSRAGSAVGGLAGAGGRSSSGPLGRSGLSSFAAPAVFGGEY